MRHLMNVSSLSNTNSTKILELEDELASSLRDVVAGRDELDMASFTEDEVLSLTAICARLCTLAGMRDMTAWAEEDESGKQSSVWDILSALAERGKLGYKEEETVDFALISVCPLVLSIMSTDGRECAQLSDSACNVEDKRSDRGGRSVTGRGSIQGEAARTTQHPSRKGD